jgi:hypothetical protein
MQQTFPADARLNILKGTHRPLIHPPSGFCREAEAFFCTPRFIPGTSPVQNVRNRTLFSRLMYAAAGGCVTGLPNR